MNLIDELEKEFLNLYGKRPFQMTKDEKRRWKFLSLILDIEKYSKKPMVNPMTGRVISKGKYTTEITWTPFSTDIHVIAISNKDQIARRLKSIETGELFCCDGTVSSKTYKVLSIRNVKSQKEFDERCKKGRFKTNE